MKNGVSQPEVVVFTSKKYRGRCPAHACRPRKPRSMRQSVSAPSVSL